MKITIITGLLISLASLEAHTQSSLNFTGQQALAGYSPSVLGHGVDIHLPQPLEQQADALDKLKLEDSASALRLRLSNNEGLDLTLDISGLSLTASF